MFLTSVKGVINKFSKNTKSLRNKFQRFFILFIFVLVKYYRPVYWELKARTVEEFMFEKKFMF